MNRKHSKVYNGVCKKDLNISLNVKHSQYYKIDLLKQVAMATAQGLMKRHHSELISRNNVIVG
uniref:Uncharacterized protein n=1 Tax=Schistosoma haematobium TaxID=6185 RepID=A0A095A2B8_SCHHA